MPRRGDVYLRSPNRTSRYHRIVVIKGGVLSRITVSSKYRIVIPKDVRDRLKIHPGQKFEAFAIGDRIGLVPVKPASQMRGFLKSEDASFEREPDRGL